MKIDVLKWAMVALCIVMVVGGLNSGIFASEASKADFPIETDAPAKANLPIETGLPVKADLPTKRDPSINMKISDADAANEMTQSVEGQAFVSKTFSQEEEERIISAVESRYKGQSFGCAYYQKSTLKALDIVEDAWGRAFFSYPGKMRWEYNAPEVYEIVTDGIRLWIYKPDEKQVMEGDAIRFFKGGAGGAFLSDIGMVRKSYTLFVSENNLDPAAIYLTLIPIQENPDIASIKVRVMKEENVIQQIITTNIYGDTTEIIFSEIQFQELSDDLFYFQVPDGVDVIPMG